MVTKAADSDQDDAMADEDGAEDEGGNVNNDVVKTNTNNAKANVGIESKAAAVTKTGAGGADQF